MALGGGSWVYTNKIMPGTYTRAITVGKPDVPLTNGICAGALNLDWGPDGEIFIINADEFRDKAEQMTGHTYLSDENILLREIFAHAIQFVGYRLNSGGKKAKVTDVGTAKYSGTAGNKITVSVLPNANNDAKFDVSTYFDGQLKEIQTVPKAGVDEIKLTKGQEKDGTAVETAAATFDFNKNKITVTFSNVPEGYKPSVRIKGQVGILAFIPGRMEDQSLSNGNKHIVTYSPGAPINGEMTIEAVLTKDKVTVLKSCTYTCELVEDVQTGADATALKDNLWVDFNKTGIIEPNASYVFTGGNTKTDITVQSHVDALNAFEPYFYNAMFCDSTDDTIKALYVENVERLCEERGKYFQLYVYDYLQADSEKVVSVKNEILNTSDIVKESSLVCWTAGYGCAIDMAQELTNKPYDGELEIYTGYPEVQLEILLQQGNFLFHNISLDDVRTLVDINTLQTYTENKDDQFANNKVVRNVFDIHNKEENIINTQDIGTLKNNPEGRTVLWNHCVDILNEKARAGALRDFDPNNVVVNEVADNKYAVTIDQVINIEGTIRQVYITTYVVE